MTMTVVAPAPGDVPLQSTSPMQQPAPASRRPTQLRREAKVNKFMLHPLKVVRGGPSDGSLHSLLSSIIISKYLQIC